MSRDTKFSIAGAFFCILIFSITFLINDNRAYYFNLVGITIVLSGTIGAIFISYPFDSLKAAYKVALSSYREKPAMGEDIINILLLLSLKAKDKGILSLERDEKEESFTFLKNALGLMVDGFKENDLRVILSKEVMFFKERRMQHERVFRHMANIAPAFGITGSVIGLIDMLTGVGDPGVILQTIPIALTSTLYGIVLSNFLLTPIAENIHSKTQKEILDQKIVIEGVVAIINEQNPRFLKKKLESFLTPSLRSEKILSFSEIRSRYMRLYGEGTKKVAESAETPE